MQSLKCGFCKAVLIATGVMRNLRKAVSSYEDPLQTSWLSHAKLQLSLIFPHAVPKLS